MDMTMMREKYVAVMNKTLATLENVVAPLSQEQATTWRDGHDGWTTVEVLCQLRDFDEIFRRRAEMIVKLQTPQLPGYDHEQMAADNRYNDQELATVLAELKASREKTHAFFAGLSTADWENTGVHPEFGTWSLTRAVMQVSHHDIDHTEQITRIIATHAPR